MGKRIMFMDADFSENGLKPVVDNNWVFGLVYQEIDSTESSILNDTGMAVYDAANCNNCELTQKRITGIRYDAATDGVFQLLKVNKEDYTNFEIIQEIVCVAGNSQEAEVNIEVGSSHYLGVRNKPSCNNPLHYYDNVGNYGAGMHFVMLNATGKEYDFPNSVIRIDFLSETEKWE